MTLSKRVLLIIGMMIIALVSAACGGGGGTGSAQGDAAKAFLDATFKGDFNALRNATCERVRGELTAEQEAAMSAMVSELGNVDTSAVTYTFDSANNTVTLGGTIKVTIQGTTVDAPISEMFMGGLPVVEEGGSWKVCIDPAQLGG